MVPVEYHSGGGFRGPIERWTAPDLTLAIGGFAQLPTAGRLSARLARRVRELIRTGVLVPGSGLPASRAMADELGVSRGVVVLAYEQLLAEGFLTSRQGAGTRVAASVGVPVPPRAQSPPPPAARPGLPDLGCFPRSRWLAAYRQALTAMSSADFGYGDPRGHAELREELSGYLGRTRGALADKDLLMVVNGVAEGLALLADVLVAAGRTVAAIEDPASPGTRTLLTKRGLDLVAVPVDEEGLEVHALPDSVGAVVITPAHQYPTGTVLSAARRRALIDLARQRDMLLIEDDYDGAFRYTREPVGCLQGLAPDVTVLLGSVSKTLAPALRLGWMIAPRRWHGPLVARRLVTDLAGASVDQIAFANLLSGGDYDRHLRKMRRRYHERRRMLLAAIQRTAPGIITRSDPGGLHLLAELPPGTHEPTVVATLRSAGFDVLGLAECRDRAGGAGGVVVGYAALREDSVARLVGILAQSCQLEPVSPVQFCP